MRRVFPCLSVCSVYSVVSMKKVTTEQEENTEKPTTVSTSKISLRIEAYKFSFSELRITRLAINATTRVVMLPIRAYQVHAIFVPNKM